MPLHKRTADADRVHDRKNAGLAEVSFFRGWIIREQAPHMRRAAQEAGGRPRAHQRVELACGQHVGERAMRGDRLEVDVRRQADRGALVAAGVLETAAAPANIRWHDAVFVLQDAAHPDVGGDLIFGHADGLALEVLRAGDAAVGADIDAAVVASQQLDLYYEIAL